jgi:hypothetical protein
MTTTLIEQLRIVFEQNQIPFKVDDRLKHMSGIEYYGLHKHSRCLYLTHAVSPDEFLQVHVPNSIKPRDIEKKYGIKGEKDPENDICNFAHIYLLRIPISDDRLNGKFSVIDKETFFIDMAQNR